LRALAVTLVVVYHVWLGRVSGGVDVFFVLTGFLLTGQLARAAANGTMSVTTRWRRTFIRLTPAALTVLVGTMVLAVIALPQGRWPQTVREIVASALFFENWQLAADSVDYAARNNAVSVVQHFWSLSIQGQFSLVFPLVVALVALMVRSSPAKLHGHLTIVLLGIFSASLVYSVALTMTDQPFAYFNSLTRLWEFAIGGLLALWIDRIVLSMRVRWVAGWLGVCGLVACGIVLHVDSVFPGFVALWPTTCAVLVLLAGRTKLKGAADGILASKPVRYLGDISYGLYLWHWPILVVHLHGGGLDATGIGDGAVVIAAALILAVFTYELVEKPMLGRRGDGSAFRLCVVGLVVVIGLAGTWQLAAARLAERDGTIGDGLHPGAAALGDPPLPEAPLLPPPISVYGDFVRTDLWNCEPLPEYDAPMCTQPFDGQPTKRIVIVGDSHSQQFTGVLIPLAAKNGWQLTTMLEGACPFSTDSDTDPNNPNCAPFNKAALDEIEEMRPDAVVTLGTLNVREGLTERTPPGFVNQWRALDQLDIPVVAFRDNPRYSYSIPDCVENNPRGSTECGGERSDFYAAQPPWTQITDLPKNVKFVDTADAVCDAQRCPAEVGNVLVYLDDNHLTWDYATTMAGVLEKPLHAAFGW
jgi:peptidoglycan/LPS O-acetylase OafA/YrhL